jgi:hypothetical protein
VLAGSPGLIRNRSHASPSRTGDLGIAMANPTRNAWCPDHDQGASNRHSATTNAMMGESTMNFLPMSGTRPDV